MWSNIRSVIVDFIDIFIRKKVMRSSAALSYYLMLSFFPFLICLNWIIGLFDIDFYEVANAVNGILPASAIDIVKTYMNYVYLNQSHTLLIAGVIMFITGLSAAFRLIIVTLEDINGVKRIKGIRFYISGIISSTVFLFGTYLLLLVAVFSGIIFNFIYKYIKINLYIYETLPFWLLFIYIFVVLLMLYKKASPKGYPLKKIWKGALGGAVGVILISRVFSVFIEYSAKYSLVYGSLSSVILLMVWLFMCSIMLICGNVLNYGINRLSER